MSIQPWIVERWILEWLPILGDIDLGSTGLHLGKWDQIGAVQGTVDHVIYRPPRIHTLCFAFVSAVSWSQRLPVDEVTGSRWIYSRRISACDRRTSWGNPSYTRRNIESVGY